MITIKRALRGAVGPLVAGALLASGAGLAVAGTSYSNFSTTVGKLNGNGYTGTQTKSGTGTNGNITTSQVGGSYQVDARLQKSNGSSSGSWKKNLDDGDSASLPNSISSGSSTRVNLNNDLTTPVDVQVTGKWRSN
ncbi:MAG: hypothetical protein QM650_18500 [Microlunatus sp.]